MTCLRIFILCRSAKYLEFFLFNFKVSNKRRNLGMDTEAMIAMDENDVSDGEKEREKKRKQVGI